MNDYEILGRLHADYSRLRVEYSNLLELVARIKRGEVQAEHVEIGPGDSWRIVTPSAEPPAV